MDHIQYFSFIVGKLLNKKFYKDCLFKLLKLPFSGFYFPVVHKSKYFGSKYFPTNFCLPRISRNYVDINRLIKKNMLCCPQDHKLCTVIYSQMHDNQI